MKDINLCPLFKVLYQQLENYFRNGRMNMPVLKQVGKEKQQQYQ